MNNSEDFDRDIPADDDFDLEEIVLGGDNQEEGQRSGADSSAEEDLNATDGRGMEEKRQAQMGTETSGEETGGNIRKDAGDNAGKIVGGNTRKNVGRNIGEGIGEGIGKSAGGQTGKSRKHHFGWIIPVALACVFAFSFYKFLSQYLTYQQAINEYKEMDSMITEIPEDAVNDAGAAESADAADAGDGSDAADDGIPDVEEPDYPKLAIDFDGLAETNSEFVGVISIPALDLRYPVAQADNNDKYLHTTFEGTSNASGCIFLDCTASKDFSDWNTYVFGHNMKNQTMFGSLKRFISDEDLCDTDPYVYIYVRNHAGDTVTEQILGQNYERTLKEDETRILVYRIFAYYTIPVDDDVYDDFAGEDGYDAYVADAERHSLYTPEDGAVDWSLRPDLLTLSTCYATGHVNNFIVQGALVGIAHER